MKILQNENRKTFMKKMKVNFISVSFSFEIECENIVHYIDEEPMQYSDKIVQTKRGITIHMEKDSLFVMDSDPTYGYGAHFFIENESFFIIFQTHKHILLFMKTVKNLINYQSNLRYTPYLFWLHSFLENSVSLKKVSPLDVIVGDTLFFEISVDSKKLLVFDKNKKKLKEYDLPHSSEVWNYTSNEDFVRKNFKILSEIMKLLKGVIISNFLLKIKDLNKYGKFILEKIILPSSLK